MQNNNQILPKIICLVGLCLIIGLPINNHFKLLSLCIALVFLVCGQYRSIYFYKLLRILACLFVIVFIKFTLPQLNISETNNVFLLNNQNPNNINFYHNNLPPEVFNYFSEQFNNNYLESANCNLDQPNCWKQYVPINKDNFNAFSADSFWLQNKSTISRVVNNINIQNRIDAKIGTLNDIKYNFFDPPTNNIYREKMPFFIIYKIPKELLGMKLYWQGDVLWPKKTLNLETYELISHTDLSPKTISITDLEKNIYISGIKNIESPIKIHLEKNIFYKLLDFFEKFITIIGVTIILSIFSYPNKTKLSLIFAAVLFQLLNIIFFAKPLLQGMPILVGGGDGLVFYGYARLMLQHLMSGNYFEVFRGLEDSFYFMPGLRYVRLIELILFGDTFYGYLLFLLSLPIIIFYFLRTIFPLKTSMILLGLFFIPWLKYFGFADATYIKFTLTGYSETLAYGLFLLSCGMIINLINKKIFIANFFIANFLLAIAVFLRPNLIISSTILIFWGIWQIRNKLSIKQVITILLGFSPILFMLWHNIYYANEFALFTGKKSLYINLITPPITYWHSICEIFNGKLSTATQHIQNQLYLWNRSVYFFRIPAVLAAIYCLIGKKINYQIRLIALLGITMQLQLLFFNPKIRYATLAWFFCFLTMVYFIIKVFNNERYKSSQSSY